MLGKISRLDGAKKPQAGAHQKSASLNSARHLSPSDGDLTLQIKSLASSDQRLQSTQVTQSRPESSSIGMLWQRNKAAGGRPMPGHLVRPLPSLLAKNGQIEAKHLDGIVFVAAEVQPNPPTLGPLRIRGKSYKPG